MIFLVPLDDLIFMNRPSLIMVRVGKRLSL